MMRFDVIGSESSHRFHQHRGVRRKHAGTRPMRATRGSAKSVIQITLIERRDRLDRALRFVDTVKRDGRGRRQYGQTNRDRVASRREDHKAIERAASSSKLFNPDQSSCERRIDVWLQFGFANAKACEPPASISDDQPRVHARQMPAIIARAHGFLDFEAGLKRFNHCRQFVGEFLSSQSRLSNASPSTQGQSASLESHLLGAFEGQSFGSKLARYHSPGPRPTITPAREYQLAVRNFPHCVLRFKLCNRALILEEFEFALEQKAFELVLDSAEIEDDGGMNHRRVLAGAKSEVKFARGERSLDAVSRSVLRSSRYGRRNSRTTFESVGARSQSAPCSGSEGESRQAVVGSAWRHV